MAMLRNERQVTILIAEDDDGHAELIRDILLEAGVRNPTRRFCDGREVLDFLLSQNAPGEDGAPAYLLLLDIRMPRTDGIEVLRQLKAHSRLHAIPVIILTTTDDPREVQGCYALGCNCYVTKPVDFGQFRTALTRLGLFLLIMQVPQLDEAPARGPEKSPSAG